MSTAAEMLGEPMSWEDYAALGDEVRGEYLDGRLVMTPTPTRGHQHICYRLAQALDGVVPEHEVTLAWGWKPAADEFGPDVMVHQITDENVRFTGMPLLVVEVLSTNRSDDLVRKSTKYAAIGLTDYWIVDPREHAVETYVLCDGAYVSSGRFETGTATLTFDDHSVQVDVDALLA